MKMILNIGGTDYDGGPDGRPAARIFDLSLRLSVEDAWSLEFSVLPCGADVPFVPGQQVTLTTTADDGSSPTLRFAGDVGRPEVQASDNGYLWGYTCTDLKHRASYVTLLGLDGSGTANFNLSPDDPLSLYATNGRTVGQIVRAVLESPHNAMALDGVGVGAYTSLTPPTLPAPTLADLAALDVVARQPVQLQGMSILNRLEEFVLQWHPQFCSWVEPDGTIRFANVFGFTPHTLTVPTDATTGDPIDWPQYTGPDCSGCFTACQIQGLDIRTAYLSEHDGTLSHAWSNPDQAGWTILDFTQPRGSVDDGSITAITSTSATVHSDHAAAHWVSNFWNDPDVQGWIYLENLAGTGTGIDLFDVRQVTNCSALAAGGSATVGWDAGLPITSTGYTRYRLVGRNTKKALVGREFHVREPSTGAVDLDTLVGKHLYPRNPKGAPVGNNSRVFDVFYPYALVQWSRTGVWPWFEVPVNVQVRPDTGRIVLAEPAVLKSCGLAGTTSVLASRYPQNFADGLYYDVKVAVPFNRGDLVARSPAFDASGPGFEPAGMDPGSSLPAGWDPAGVSGAAGWRGTAFSKYGIRRLKVIPLDSWTWFGDQPDLVHLADQYLQTYQDAVIEGGTVYHGIPTAFDPFALPYALTFVTPGQATPIDGLALPVRSAIIRLTSQGGDIFTTTFAFSNLKRPFCGDTLFTHPAFGLNTFGTEGDVMAVGEGGGMMSLEDFNGRMPTTPMDRAMERYREAPKQAAPSTAANWGPTGPLSQAPAGQAPAGQEAAGMAPAGQDVGSNPIAAALAGPQGGQQGVGGEFDTGGMGGIAGPIGGRGARQTDAEKATGARREARQKAEADFARQSHARSPEARTGKQREAREAAEGQFARQSHGAGLQRDRSDVDTAHPNSIMNMRPDPNKAGFGQAIDPDTPYPKSIGNQAKARPPIGTPIDPDAPSSRPPPTPEPPRTTLRQRRGLEDEDTTTMGGG